MMDDLAGSVRFAIVRSGVGWLVDTDVKTAVTIDFTMQISRQVVGFLCPTVLRSHISEIPWLAMIRSLAIQVPLDHLQALAVVRGKQNQNWRPQIRVLILTRCFP